MGWFSKDKPPSRRSRMEVANDNLPQAKPFTRALMLRAALKRDHPVQRELRPLLDHDALRAPPVLGTLLRRLGAVQATPENAFQKEMPVQSAATQIVQRHLKRLGKRPGNQAGPQDKV